MIGAVLTSAAYHLAQLVIGRVILGFGVGMCLPFGLALLSAAGFAMKNCHIPANGDVSWLSNTSFLHAGLATQSVPVYLSEMAPTHVRGLLNIMFQLSITIGILIAECINLGERAFLPVLRSMIVVLHTSQAQKVLPNSSCQAECVL